MAAKFGRNFKLNLLFVKDITVCCKKAKNNLQFAETLTSIKEEVMVLLLCTILLKTLS